MKDFDKTIIYSMFWVYNTYNLFKSHAVKKFYVRLSQA